MMKTAPPEGFVYAPELIDPAEEAEIAERIAELPLKEFEFRGYVGRRRVVSFGWRYDFGDASLREAEEIPSFLRPLRGKAAALAGLEPEALAQVLVSEYSPGSTIGWHRDRAVFGEVVGVSLVSSCVFRLRRKAGAGWERYTLDLEPRSAYLLRGPARTEWEHSLRPVDALRYAVTFRTLRRRG